MGDAAMYVAVAAACIARGLSQEQADQVWGRIAMCVEPGSVWAAHSMLTGAIERVGEER